MLKELILPTSKNNFEAILLKKPFIFVYFILLLAANYFAPVYLPNYNTVIASNITSDKLIDLTNLDRKNVGLNQLTQNSMLDQAAHAKALDMLDKDYWNHFGPDGETPWQFIKGAGYDPYKFAGENLAKGFSTAEGVHQAWMASPTHKANIMDGDYRDIGMAVVDGYLGGQKVTLVVQMFGTLKSDNTIYTGINGEIVEEYETDIKPGTPENGETTSIKISYPESGAIINDATAPIGGVVKDAPDDARIIVSDGNVLLGEVDTVEGVTNSDSKWEYTTDTDWNQGDYKIDAVVRREGEDLATASVNFTVDSLGPDLTLSMLTFSNSTTVAEVLFTPKEKVDAYMTVDNSLYPFLERDGSYVVSVPIEKYNNALQITVTASDVNGNKSEVFVKNEEGEFSVASILGLTSTSGAINFSFLAGLLGLILLQVAQYTKLGLLQHKAHYLFAGIMFASVLIIGIITKSAGVIG